MIDTESFQAQKPTAYNTYALDDSELLLISRASLDKLYSASPPWEHYFSGYIDREYATALARISDLIGALTEERYLHFLTIYPDLCQRVPLSKLLRTKASHLKP